MPAPSTTVNVVTALPRRGAPSTTGTAFFATSTGTGPTTPTRLTSLQAAESAFGAGPFATWVGDTLAEGTPEVVAVRATGALAALTAAEWTTALDKFTVAEFGVGQVAIPGVATAAAHDALVAHAAANRRTALLDGADNATAAALATLGTNQAAKSGAKHTAVFGPWVPYGATDRLVPGSVLGAGLAARGDARVGHTNHSPAGSHSGGAGVLRRANKVATTFTAAERDTLSDAGVNVFINTPQGPTLDDWVSVSTDPQYRQLNHGRMVMKLGHELKTVLDGFKHMPHNQETMAGAEGGLRGYLQPFWPGALFGDTPDEAFDVKVDEVNTDADAAAGRLNAAVAVRFTSSIRDIVINVTTHLADGTV